MTDVLQQFSEIDRMGLEFPTHRIGMIRGLCPDAMLSLQLATNAVSEERAPLSWFRIGAGGGEDAERRETVGLRECLI